MISESTKVKALELREEGLTYKEIGEALSIHRTTAYKWCNPDRPKQYNREKKLEYQRSHYQDNKTTIAKRVAEYQKGKLKTDPIFRLRKNLRTRLNQAIKNHQKTGSAVSDLGCSIEFLKKYLEDQFTEEMSWENRSSFHIDHIRPLSSFDLEDREQFLQAVHYTNLQPLTPTENLKKGDKYDF